MTSADPAILARARHAAARLAPLASEIETARRLPAEAVAALVEAGVFKLLVPRAFGGAETDVATLLSVIEILAQADGSAGWCAMIGASSGLMCGFLEDEVAREVYGPADAISCGVFAPMGRATPENGGYRVAGRWPFASGSQHAGWCMGGAFVAGAAPLANGAPDVRSFLFRSSEIHIHDTWDVSGLRGTGSHDFEVRDQLVPAQRSFSLLSDAPRQPALLYRQPFFGVLAAGVAAVTLGIARAAIDALVTLARGKHAAGARRTLAHRELVQLKVAEAEGRLGGARAFLFQSVAEVASAVEAHGRATLEARARLRLAAAHAATECAAVVHLMYQAGGGTSIYANHPLQRQFRDVHTATQHVMVSSTSAVLAGRVLLGVETDTSTL